MTEQAKKNLLTAHKLEQGCAVCGYNRCAQALDYSHRPGHEKDGNMAAMHRQPLHRMLAELVKCDVLCVRCHREYHAGVIPYPVT